VGSPAFAVGSISPPGLGNENRETTRFRSAVVREPERVMLVSVNFACHASNPSIAMP
jgi:hypothetical protein